MIRALLRWLGHRVPARNTAECDALGEETTVLVDIREQIVPNLAPATVSTVEEFANVYQSESDLAATRYWMWPNPNDGVMADADVRRAVTMAIDRGRVVDTVLRGYGYPISTLPSANEGGKYYSELAQAWGSDPDIEEGKRIIEEAGVAGQQVHLVMGQSPTKAAVADSVQQQLEAIGFTVLREDLTIAAAFTKLIEGDFDLFLHSDTPAYGESGLDATGGLFSIGGSYNFNGVNDQELSDLVIQATIDDDPATIEAMRQRQLEYVPDMPIALSYLLTGVAKDLEGFEMYNYGDYTGFAYTE